MSRTFTERRPIVVLDTNMLMLMASGIAVLDYIEEELESKPRFVVLKPVYNEILRIANSSTGLLKRRAALALELVHRFCEVVNYELLSGESVDDAIIRYALENGAVVASSDQELRRKLRKLGIPEAYFKEESGRILIEGYYK